MKKELWKCRDQVCFRMSEVFWYHTNKEEMDTQHKQTIEPVLREIMTSEVLDLLCGNLR